MNRRVVPHYMRLVAPEFRGKRPDEAFRALLANVALPQASRQPEQCKHILDAFAESFLGHDCPELGKARYMLVNLMQDLLALDASLHPTEDKGVPGLGSLKAMALKQQTIPPMSLDELLDRNKAPGSMPAFHKNTIEEMYKAIVATSLHEPVGSR